MPRKKKNDLNLPPGVSHEWRESGSLRLKWRNRIQLDDGSIGEEQKSTTVSGPAEARELGQAIGKALREHGYFYVEDGRYRASDVDLEDVFLGYLEWKRDFEKRSPNTISNIAHAFGRFVRGHRELLDLEADDMIPARSLTLDAYRQWVMWANTEGNGGAPYGEGTVYQTAFVILDAWTWAADQTTSGSTKWPTLPTPPFNVSSNLPPKPDYEPPTDIGFWSELDAVINRIYTPLPESQAWNVYRAFWMTIVQRYTGLRVFQAAGLLREDFDEAGLTILVRRGKSRREKALNRRMAASPHLFRALQPLLATGGRTGPLFPDSNDLTVPVRSYRNPTKYLTEGWDRAIADGHARATVVRPPGRKKAVPNHAFRSALQQWLEEEGVRGRVIDWLVGHAPADTRGRHYVRPSMASQQKAVALIPEITWEDMPFPRHFGLYRPEPEPDLADVLNWASMWTGTAAIC